MTVPEVVKAGASPSKVVPAIDGDTVGGIERHDTIGLEESNNADQTVLRPKGCFGARHTFALMAFLGLAAVYMLRVNLSVAIVSMINRTEPVEPVDLNSSFLCPVPVHTNATTIPSTGEFSWDSKTQGLILGCFFWGYIVTQLPGGLLAERFGGKYVFGLGVFFTGFFSLLMPIAARWNLTAFIVVRVLTGAAEGITIPSLNVMLSRWVPYSERSTIGAFVLAGMQFGTVISLPLSGYLCEVPFDNGWPLTFYVPGALAIIWFIFWVFLVYDGPDVHPRISDDENQYIVQSTGRKQGKQAENQKKLTIPWGSIFTSMPFWAIFVAHIGQCWGFYVLLTDLPTYMKTVLHFDLKSNSLLSALPYLAMWILSNVFSNIADALRTRKVINLQQTRKIFSSIGHLVPACALIGVVFTGCDRVSTIALITVAVGFNGAVYSGFNINHVDIAPNFAGILMGLTNSAGNICGFLAPYIVGEVVTNEGSLDQWNLIFYVSAGVYVAADLFYVIFASGEKQWWNEPKETQPEELTT